MFQLRARLLATQRSLWTAEDTGGLKATLAIQVTVTATATNPGKPTGLTATADGQTEIDLSWTAPPDDGGADITGYKHRGLDQRVKLERPGGRHRFHQHQLQPHRPDSGKHTALPGVRHQLRRDGIGVGLGLGHHRIGNGPGYYLYREPRSESRGELHLSRAVRRVFGGFQWQWLRFLYITAGDRIDIRNTNINGVTYTFVRQ